jgi:hypothetical protein
MQVVKDPRHYVDLQMPHHFKHRAATDQRSLCGIHLQIRGNKTQPAKWTHTESRVTCTTCREILPIVQLKNTVL